MPNTYRVIHQAKKDQTKPKDARPIRKEQPKPQPSRKAFRSIVIC